MLFRLRLRPARAAIGLAARLPRRTVRLRLTTLYAALFLAAGTALLTITNLLARNLPWRHSVVSPPGTGPGGAGTFRPATRDLMAQVAADHATALNQFLAESAIALGIMAVASIALGWLMAGRVLRPLRQMTAAARAISEDSLDQRLAVPGPDDELKDLGEVIDALLIRLDAAFTAQRDFVASASHELRGPLTLSRTLLQMALTNPRPTLAAYRATCQDLLDANDQQEQLIEALLTLARSQRGLDRREHLDLASITASEVRTREQEAAGRGVTISTSTSPAPVLGDTRLLRRLAANLIDNAIRHNIPGGQADIKVTAADGRTRLTIANTGPVIPADQVSRLLEPFQRLPATRSADADGLGLGLSIIAAIAKAHNAVLAVSPGRHGGLSIEISFPPATAEHTPAGSTHQNLNTQDRLQGRTTTKTGRN
jgi:signal transduction histidine kinase